MQFCVAVDVSVTMQRLCGVDGDGAGQGFSRRFTPIFALLFGVERQGSLPISTAFVDIHIRLTLARDRTTTTTTTTQGRFHQECPFLLCRLENDL